MPNQMHKQTNKRKGCFFKKGKVFESIYRNCVPEEKKIHKAKLSPPHPHPPSSSGVISLLLHLPDNVLVWILRIALRITILVQPARSAVRLRVTMVGIIIVRV